MAEGNGVSPAAEQSGSSIAFIDGNQFWPPPYDSLSAAWSWVMRASPIVPGIDRDVYLLLDDFGRMGCAWREANVQDTELEAVID